MRQWIYRSATKDQLERLKAAGLDFREDPPNVETAEYLLQGIEAEKAPILTGPADEIACRSDSPGRRRNARTFAGTGLAQRP